VAADPPRFRPERVLSLAADPIAGGRADLWRGPLPLGVRLRWFRVSVCGVAGRYLPRSKSCHASHGE